METKDKLLITQIINYKDLLLPKYYKMFCKINYSQEFLNYLYEHSFNKADYIERLKTDIDFVFSQYGYNLFKEGD